MYASKTTLIPISCNADCLKCDNYYPTFRYLSYSRKKNNTTTIKNRSERWINRVIRANLSFGPMYLYVTGKRVTEVRRHTDKNININNDQSFAIKLIEQDDFKVVRPTSKK